MQPQEFIKAYAPAAISAQIQYGIPASITLAQAALESGWGKYAPGFNFFGIKDQPNDNYHGPYTAQDTSEFVNGNWIKIQALFRKYDSPTGSFKDHALFLKANKRYAPLFALSSTDVLGWATGLQQAGYATAPNYANQLISIIKGYGLTKYDDEAKKKSTPSL